MKISSMTNKWLILAIFLFTPWLSSHSQELSDIIFGKQAKTDYIGQYKDNHKKKNGMGIQRLRKGSIYIGDFSDGKMSGKGMLFAGADELPNIPGTMVYVGHLVNGKKERSGICYAANGDILYKGRFMDDKPIDTYPQQSPDELSYFTMMEWGEDIYWGEVTQSTPHGAALVMNEDGSMWYGSFDHGNRNGICITIYGEDSWEVGNWNGGKYTAFNSSELVASRRQEFVNARKELRSELRSEFWDVALGLTQSTLNLTTAILKDKHGVSETAGDAAAENSGTDKAKTGNSKNKAATGKSQSSCGTAWMSESRVYSDYESQLINHGAEMSASERQGISDKMKSIRLKWEKRGCVLAKSPYE